jgi:hypothetical protein
MPQDTQRTNALLEALLSSALTPAEIVAEIDGLIQDDIAEDIHLDYKAAAKLNNRREANEMMREYVSGFANSAGGILIVGVGEAQEGQPRPVAPCRAPGGGSLADWVSRSLTPIAGYISPPAVPYEVPHPQGAVLVVAVGRSPSLVPCFDRGDRRPLYHLRLGDQTLAADEYLVADLILGRRQHAYLEIAGVQTSRSDPAIGDDGHREWTLGLVFQIENQGLARADNVMVGAISLNSRGARQSVPLGRHLLRHVTESRPSSGKYKGFVQQLDESAR